MNYEQIIVSHEGAVCTVALARPDRLNAWTARMEEELRSAAQEAATNGITRALVITGEGRGFCSGADMKALEATAASGGAKQRPVESGSIPDGLAANYRHRFGWLLEYPLPIFAAINGPVAGIGLCLAVFCDYRYMAAGAKLTTAFARRGLIAEHGISWMLPRLVGPMNALDLLLSARAVPAEEAEKMGLVRVLPAENFLQQVQARASELASTVSPRSAAVIKRQLYDALLQSLDQAWRVADEAMQASFQSEDFREGVAHFLEHRMPRFTGR